MIVTVHCIAIIIFQILRNRKRLKQNSHDEEQILEEKLKFEPPLFRQRYLKVYEVLIDEKWRGEMKKLVDFGCGEFGLFHYIKNLSLEDILFVDIDESILQEKCSILEPLLVNRLRRRSTPLEVSVFRGTAIEPDYRLRKTDVITAVELLEHLYPDTLDALPYNIFSFVRPKLVIFTTPNADFNVVFGKKGTFRHPDHKFEWTAEQFFDWGTNITKRFPDYTVEFHGIGEGPRNYKNIGCCSQAAVFIRRDMLCESYISSACEKSCQCDKNSPCKGQTIECKLLCNCLCTVCLPDISIGICTYLSCNVKEADAFRPMKAAPKEAIIRAININPFFESLRPFPVCKDEPVNRSYNIFYKLLSKIDYPYETDTRSETERLLETLSYRIRTFSYCNSRFYIDEKQRCEIPISDIVYGGVDVTLEEVRHLLLNAGFQVEKCIIPETNVSEHCIISMPQEMDDVTSSSEVTDEFSSKSSDCNETPTLEPNIEPLSDWDEATFSAEESKLSEHEQEASSSGGSKNPNPDPLFDSGYLKSPSPLETTKRLPQSSKSENTEALETDLFEDSLVTPNLSSDDNKLHLKKAATKEKFFGALVPLCENQNSTNALDSNRINELDRFRNVKTAKTFMNNHLKPQNEFKKCPFKESPMPGTSSGWKRHRKSSKDKEKKSPDKKEPKEPSTLDDAKSLTNCIIENSLNKIEVESDGSCQSELIKDLSPLEDANDVVDAPMVQPQLEPEPQAQEPPQQRVENGDLVNNNRDNEGNNMPVNELVDLEIDEGIDLLNDNLEDLVPLLADNVDVLQNNVDLRIDIVEEARNDLVEAGAEQRLPQEPANDDVEDSSVARASREVLYDENSEQDLLEDFDIPPQASQDNTFNVLGLDTSIVLLGLHPISSEASTSRDHQEYAVGSVQTNRNSFPNWLLHILGTQVVSDDANQDQAPTGHDEPHFYCQGDGLGVHPSITGIEVDEAEDADNDSTTDESSSNNTVDYAEVDPGPSDMFDMSSLPEESSVMEDNVLQPGESGVSFETSQMQSVPLSEIASNGSELVDEVIRAAQEEVGRLSQIDVQEDASQEETRNNSLVVESPPDNAVIIDTCSLETSISSECPSLVFPSAQSSSTPLIHPSLSNNTESRNNHGNGGLSSGNGSARKPPRRDDSFNNSDKSDYFDPKTEEF